MKVVTLSGSPRANVGKKDASHLRRNGNVPCVLYGGKEQLHFYADERAFKNIIYTPEVCFVEIDVDGRKTKAILQEAQFHKVTDKLIHVDFLEIVDGKAITMDVPVKLHGQSEGVKAGGRLVLNLRKVKVKGLADKMLNHIDLDITPLTIGKSITVGDLKSEGIEFLGPKNTAVVAVTVTRAVEEETPAAGAAEGGTAEAAKTEAPKADAKAAEAKAAPKK